MESVLIYLYFFSHPLVRLGVPGQFASWIGAFLVCMAIIAFVGIFCVRSIGIQWMLFLYCMAVAMVVPLELSREIGELGKIAPHIK